MAGLDWYNGKVVDIIKETGNIRRFFIEVPEVDRFRFKSGQYIKVEFPTAHKKNYRQYSIANYPNGSNVFELLIVLNPEGYATNYMFNEVKIGSSLKISESRGNFILPEAIEKDICFICTGVGLAPLRSMYLNIIKNNIPHKNIYLVFGTRYMKDLIYIDEMQELDKRDDFHFVPVLSREISPEWTGRKGYVHDIYRELFNDGRDAEFFICGWRDMVSQARSNLMEMGYERRAIHFERYD